MAQVEGTSPAGANPSAAAETTWRPGSTGRGMPRAAAGTGAQEVACLVGLWSYNGPALLNGVRDSGKLGQVKIVCFDEEEEGLQGVKDGFIAGTIVQLRWKRG